MKYIDIDEFIEILKNFDIVDCEFKKCEQCELQGDVCDILIKISNKLKECKLYIENKGEI